VDVTGLIMRQARAQSFTRASSCKCTVCQTVQELCETARTALPLSSPLPMRKTRSSCNSFSPTASRHGARNAANAAARRPRAPGSKCLSGARHLTDGPSSRYPLPQDLAVPELVSRLAQCCRSALRASAATADVREPCATNTPLRENHELNTPPRHARSAFQLDIL
jgi:hypothetical protein